LAVQKKSPTRKEQILQAAEQVFAQKGFHDATIADVARKAKVSEATIYEYFPSKEELLFLIPGATARRGKENLEHVLRLIRSAADKIRAFLYDHLNFYQNHPDYASVSMLILKPNRKFVETEAYKDVQELARVLLQVIKEGMASGEFRSDLDPYLVRSAILGTIEHLVVRRVLLGKPENLIALVDPLTDLILGGIKAPEEEKAWHFQVNLGAEKKKAAERRPPLKNRGK
jgi:TetR/AcrR family fatty acid metabolism transcriptional regulator